MQCLKLWQTDQIRSPGLTTFPDLGTLPVCGKKLTRTGHGLKISVAVLEHLVPSKMVLNVQAQQ